MLFDCLINRYLIFSSTELSSWLLVALTFERIISTTWPYKVRMFCTPKTALVTILTLWLIIYGGSAHLLYGTGIEQQDVGNLSRSELVSRDQSTGSISLRTSVTFGTPVLNTGNGSAYAFTDDGRFCGALTENQAYKDFFKFVYPWIDLFLYIAIPAIILAVGEVLIVRKLLESRKMRQNMSTVRAATTLRNTDKSMSIALMLVVVNAVFILCTTPIGVYLVCMPYWVDAKVGFTETQEVIWTIVNLLMYLNHTINFILYFLSGARFRRSVHNFFARNQTGISFALREVNSSEERTQAADRRSPMNGSHRSSVDDSKPDVERMSINTIGTSVSEYYINGHDNI